MKEIRAKLTGIRRQRLSGIGNGPQYDDNVIALKTKIIEGPAVSLDKIVNVTIGISELVDSLPDEVADRLFTALNEARMNKIKEEEETVNIMEPLPDIDENDYRHIGF